MAPPITTKEAITPTMTKVFPVDALSFLASCTPSLSVSVLLPGSVVVVCCSGVKSVVEVSLVKSLDRVVVSGVLVDIFVKGAVEVTFCFIYNVVALAVVLKFVPAVVVTCEDIVVVRRVALLFAVEALVEVVMTAVHGEDVYSTPITSCHTFILMLNMRSYGTIKNTFFTQKFGGKNDPIGYGLGNGKKDQKNNKALIIFGCKKKITPIWY